MIEIWWRISWRRSYSSSLYCDASTIANEVLVQGQGNLACYSSCSGSVSLNFYCTDFSENEDWTSGVHTVTFNSGTPSFGMRFTGGDWISSLIIGADGSWALSMSVNLTIRHDTGMPNSSPISSITPIVRLQYGCNHTLVIPVSDPDGDTVRCRWAVGNGECSDVCDGFPNAVLDEATCTITYQAKYQTGWYAVALMIEDFASSLSTSPLSQIPLQFLVDVYNNNMSCSSAPYFVDPTPKDGACIAVPENETYFQVIFADSGMDGSWISEIITVSPLGFSKSQVGQVQSDNRLFYVNLTWTPTKQQEGENILCFTAENTEGVSSPQSCIKLVAGMTSPAIIPESLEPKAGAEIASDHSTWRMKFDKEFVRPTKPTFISFYDGNDNLVYSIDVSSSSDVVYGPMTNRSITFMANGLQLLEKQSYYILMDAGVATGLEACGSESSIIRDPFFWTFTIHTGCECLNGGTCLTNDDSTSTCQCPYGFVGPTCKRIAGYCAYCAQP